MLDDWWLRYVPAALESHEVYVQRVTGYDEMAFVMMQLTEEELDVVGASYDITKVRHAYEKGLFAVMVIRDLVFLTFTERWSNAAN